MNSTLVTLPGYHLTELIHTGERTLVYRAQNQENGQPVIIKLMRHEYPSFRELVQFRNQYAIAKNLDIEGIVKSIALERYEKRYALIMEDTGGVSLAEYEGLFSLSVAQFLQIAIQLSQILHQLHNHSIIHKDIKPANILIHPETQQIKLIDFSISSLLPKETPTLQTPNVLEGTLAYLSPEQTGRMNRGIDYRSDFYSLGVTFYQLLTGTLPFNKKDPLELIHAHLAERPTSISMFICLGGKVGPQALSDIVLKLMAKNAEDRYQSALGLKYDLEKCLVQYQETATIEPFELGQRDICDRFNIPEKLYGRETEVQTLLDAFERVATGTSEMMLVAGFSGIGKTAVVNEVHKPIVKQRGYFIKGKFDQFNRNIPFSAFVIAFRSLMGQILGESDAQLADWKTKILEAVGNNGQVLIEVIPELESVIGEQPSVLELSGSAAQNRFNLLFEKFIAVFTTPEHPLVIFLDDLQWADLASLNLMKVLMADSQTGYLLLLGAYRDNEVSPTHPLMLTLQELVKRCDPVTGKVPSLGNPHQEEESSPRGGILTKTRAPREKKAVISTITLNPLGEHHISQLVAETLHCQEKIAQPLSELVYRKTQGNPFFTTQFLKGLHRDNYITFHGELGYWQCDLSNVQDAALTNDVVEFMMGRLQNLPPVTQEMLKLAACIGNQFDLETLGIIAQQSLEEVASNLWRALQEGLVLPISDTYKFFQGVSVEEQQSTNLSVGYRFLHDRVQQAAYTLIPEQQRQVTHLNIGQLLLKKTPSQQREEKIFAIVNQLNMGRELIVSPPKRDELAQLNLSAGNKAKSATAHDSAWEYYTTGIGLLTPECWQSQYDFTLALYLGATEAAYLSANFEEVERYGNIVLEQGVSILDKVKVYEIQIQVGMAKNELLQAVQIALAVLKSLGIVLPENPTMEDIQATLQEVGMLCEGKSIDDFINLPRMSEPSKIAALQILSIVIPPATISAPALFPLIVAQQVILCVKYGNAPLSAYAYVGYGFLLCATPEGIERGSQFGQLGLRMLEQSNSQELKAKILMLFNGFVYCWKNHLKETLQPLAEAYKSALESGDLEFAGYSIIHDVWHLFCIGWYLSELEKKASDHINFLSQIKLGPVLVKAQLLQQLILNLIGESENPLLLKGAVYDEDIMLPLHQENKDGVTISLLYTYKLFLCYLFNIPNQGLEYIKKAEPYLDTIRAIYWIAVFYFYDSLTHLAIYSETPEGQLILKRVAANQERMQAWANHAPMNFQHKYDLVEAETHRVLDRKMAALEFYDRAIAGAQENEYLQEEALANELAALFYLDWGKEKIARTYLIDAYYCYARWGAKAKTDQLEQLYLELLKPILQQERTSSTLSTSLSTVTSHSHTATIADISSILDFSSLLKASQTLSGEIELESLLSTLMKIILENAGATKGALLLTSDMGLTLEALATRTETKEELQFDSLHQSISLDNYPDLPTGLIKYVRRTTETTLLDAKTAQEQFASDRYLLNFSPQSLLCMPLLERGNLIGILYLENRLTADAFTSDRIELLDALCAQAAISLTNARLYQQAQQALQDLQEAQLQLVQNEKMATLGNLVAGVAHEINNPVGFIGGNISAAQEYLQDLLYALKLYQQKYSSPDAELTEELEDLDLEFITEDFPKLLASMETGCDRIGNISTSLRTFSRTDTASKTEFNLHAGIESTLLILKYRLKANDNRPGIEIIKQYGNIPVVKCYAGQLNQVFMNLIANAIDALEESNEGKTYSDIEKAPNRITIATEFIPDDNNVMVKITDNGTGMDEKVRGKIFEQGFTTKGVGKGTGLGMAIAWQIITEKHDGTISCLSELRQGTTFVIKIPLEA